MKLNCIAIDDEPLALGLISNYIKQTPELNLTGQYSSAVEALKAIREEALDLIFLDIRMPELSGMELARIIEQRNQAIKPRIIFTTAYDEYALEGYKVDALDYLLKPFNFVDFSKAVNKAFNYFSLTRHQHPPSANTAIVQQEPAVSPADPFLYIKVEHQMLKISQADILYVEGLKDYVKIFLARTDKPILTISSLKNLEEKLPADQFMRIHRSYIVSLNHINAVTRNSVQISNINIPVSDQYKESFNNFRARWQ